MLGKERLLQVLDESIAYGLQLGADQVEVIATNGSSYLTRYAINCVDHNTGATMVSFQVRVVWGKRIGSATVASLSSDRIKIAVQQAVALAKLADPDPYWCGLPVEAPLTWIDSWSVATQSMSAAERGQIVAAIIEEAQKRELEVAGIISNGEQEMAVANSCGTRSYQQRTEYCFTVTAMTATSSGYASSEGWDIGDLDWRRLVQSAMQQAEAAQNPIALPPGEYEVILEPYAAAVLFGFFGRLALSGQAYEEGRSLVAGRMGQKLISDKLTIWDDGFDLRGLPKPFDIEGVAKKKLDLVQNGHVINVCYDSYTAGQRAGLQSTGHAAPFDSYESGPFPVNLFVQPGQATLQDMIAKTERGLWITRFHYTNAIDPYHIVVTGMTRDAMFFIENGQIVSAVKPLRYTQNVIEALSAVQALGSELKYIGGWRGGQAVPRVKIAKFHFGESV